MLTKDQQRGIPGPGDDSRDDGLGDADSGRKSVPLGAKIAFVWRRGSHFYGGGPSGPPKTSLSSDKNSGRTMGNWDDLSLRAFETPDRAGVKSRVSRAIQPREADSSGGSCSSRAISSGAVRNSTAH